MVDSGRMSRTKLGTVRQSDLIWWFDSSAVVEVSPCRKLDARISRHVLTRMAKRGIDSLFGNMTGWGQDAELLVQFIPRGNKVFLLDILAFQHKIP